MHSATTTKTTTAPLLLKICSSSTSSDEASAATNAAHVRVAGGAAAAAAAASWTPTNDNNVDGGDEDFTRYILLNTPASPCSLVATMAKRCAADDGVFCVEQCEQTGAMVLRSEAPRAMFALLRWFEDDCPADDVPIARHTFQTWLAMHDYLQDFRGNTVLFMRQALVFPRCTVNYEFSVRDYSSRGARVVLRFGDDGTGVLFGTMRRRLARVNQAVRADVFVRDFQWAYKSEARNDVTVDIVTVPRTVAAAASAMDNRDARDGVRANVCDVHAMDTLDADETLTFRVRAKVARGDAAIALSMEQYGDWPSRCAGVVYDGTTRAEDAFESALRYRPPSKTAVIDYRWLSNRVARAHAGVRANSRRAAVPMAPYRRSVVARTDDGDNDDGRASAAQNGGGDGAVVDDDDDDNDDE